MSDRDENPKALEEDLRKSIDTNVIGNIHFYNLFMPLVLKGKAKKVICISTGMADIDLINKFDLETGSLYSISKAAMNVATAKFNAQYKKDGVLFLSISPGVVDVDKVDLAQCTNNPSFPLLLSLSFQYKSINLTPSLV
jgi:NAD(P)-dependent dehydrogenase (short-subunit alcohol dehydrogenase family)